jgi:hypothetical protein
MVQPPEFAARLVQLFVWEKSPEFNPGIVTLVIVTMLFPVLVTVIDLALLVVLIIWLPKLQEVGEK